MLVAALADTGHEGRWAETTIAKGALAGPKLALAEASDTLRRTGLDGQTSRIEAAGAHP